MYAYYFEVLLKAVARTKWPAWTPSYRLWAWTELDIHKTLEDFPNAPSTPRHMTHFNVVHCCDCCCTEPETTRTTLHLPATSSPVVASTATPLQSASTHGTEAATGVSTGLKTTSEKDDEEKEENKIAKIAISLPDQLEVKVTSPAPEPVLKFNQMTKLPHAQKEALKQEHEDDSQKPGNLSPAFLLSCVRTE